MFSVLCHTPSTKGQNNKATYCKMREGLQGELRWVAILRLHSLEAQIVSNPKADDTHVHRTWHRDEKRRARFLSAKRKQVSGFRLQMKNLAFQIRSSWAQFLRFSIFERVDFSIT